MRQNQRKLTKINKKVNKDLKKNIKKLEKITKVVV